MDKYIKKCNKIILILGISMLFLFITLLPFIINFIYQIKPPIMFFDIGFVNGHSGYNSSDLLEYYGTALSFVTTSILTIVIIVQTKRANEKSDEVNELILKNQEQQLVMAKERFNRDKEVTVASRNVSPKFEVMIAGYNGNYANLRLSVKNVSSLIISSLKGIKFEICDHDGEVLKYTDGSIIPKTIKFEFEKRSIKSGESTIVETDTPNMRKDGNIWNANQYHILPKNVSMKFSFSCEDETGKTYYFEAFAIIPDTKEYSRDLWDCRQVG